MPIIICSKPTKSSQGDVSSPVPPAGSPDGVAPGSSDGLSAGLLPDSSDGSSDGLPFGSPPDVSPGLSPGLSDGSMSGSSHGSPPSVSSPAHALHPSGSLSLSANTEYGSQPITIVTASISASAFFTLNPVDVCTVDVRFIYHPSFYLAIYKYTYSTLKHNIRIMSTNFTQYNINKDMLV
jgi:hypothetical protein